MLYTYQKADLRNTPWSWADLLVPTIHIGSLSRFDWSGEAEGRVCEASPSCVT